MFDHYKTYPTTPNIAVIINRDGDMTQQGGKTLDNVAICCINMLQSFGLSMTGLQVLPMETIIVSHSQGEVDAAIYLSSTSSLSLISSRTKSCMPLISESVNVLSMDR